MLERRLRQFSMGVPGDRHYHMLPGAHGNDRLRYAPD